MSDSSQLTQNVCLTQEGSLRLSFFPFICIILVAKIWSPVKAQ
ncbi:germ cell-specific gene 1 protein isoform X5 [Chlorocebus sabaeus]